MAAAAWDLNTLANVKAWMGATATDSARDVLLQTIISDVSSFIQEFTGRTFALQTFTNEILDGNGRSKLRPKHVPIAVLYPASATTDALKLAAIQVRDDVDSAWEDVEDDLDHFWANTPTLLEENANCTHNIELYERSWPLGDRTVKLTYQAGYTNIPGRVMLVFYEMCQRAYDKSKQGMNQLGKTSTTDSRSNINESFEDLTPKWEKVLLDYRIKY